MTCPSAFDPIARIDGAARLAPVGGRPAAVAGGMFAVPAGRAAGAGAVHDVPPTALASLLALQEANDALVGESPARRRGRQMLDLLRRVQLALLTGVPDAAALTELAALTADLPAEPDPVLAGLIAGIALRARVELARGRACA